MIYMPDKNTPKEPSEIPPPDQTPEVQPDYQPEAPILPDGSPGTVPPRQPDNPWPDKPSSLQ